VEEEEEEEEGEEEEEEEEEEGTIRQTVLHIPSSFFIMPHVCVRLSLFLSLPVVVVVRSRSRLL